MNPIVRLAASALPGEKKYILFAGAGVSKDAGIPTAWDLMLKTAGLLYAADSNEVDQNINLEKWFISSKYAALEYAELIRLIYPHSPDQQHFLKQYLMDHEIGESHLAIAEMARRGIIRAIVTTNFDLFIEKALEKRGVEAQVISTDEDLDNSEPLIHCKAIRVYKPHGTLGRGALKNTPKELKSLSPLMEAELIRVMSDHGIIVLGYAGTDSGIQKVFEKRRSNLYPLFWVDPNPPNGQIEEILKRSDYTYIQCKSAAKFIQDYIELLGRLESIAPTTGISPTIPDLRRALATSEEPVGPLFSEFLAHLFSDLQSSSPDFSQFSDYDEAIVDQINRGLPLSQRFIDAALLAAKHSNASAAEELYSFFGKVLTTYTVPDGFSGSYRETDFDGFRFIGYEMFVTFVATLIRNDQWALLGQLLSQDIFIDKKYDGGYFPFTRINRYIASLDEIRNKRLDARRTSVMADVLKDRYTNSQLNELISHQEFLEADYFLFMRTVSHQDILEYLKDVWCPRACVWLDRPPSYILKSESKRFLEHMLPATGFSDADIFIQNFSSKHGVFTRCFRSGWKDDPLEYFDTKKLGQRK
mgnify:CR=1 FL=1